MIGPVDPKCARALREAHRVVLLPATVDEVNIFYHLSMDRVHYFPQRNVIYFVDSVYVPVTDILRSVFTGAGEVLLIKQLYLDQLQIFKSLKRAELNRRLAPAVMVALRLEGVQISISGE